MIVDAISGALSDLADDDPKTGVVDLGRASAAGTDDVVVMRPLAGHICMLARRQVQSFEDTKRLEQVEGTEDRGTTDRKMARSRFGEQVTRCEVPALVCDQRRQCTARFGQSMPSSVDQFDHRAIVHLKIIHEMRLSLDILDS